MFTRILIANRGEIACRIIRTARNMGIETVAIYSTADAQSPPVLQADLAFCVGNPPSLESYLNIPAIIHAAKESRAQAIHPGYGFLSENAEFAKACADAGLIFIGPSVRSLKAMASKQLAKQLLEKTQVPLTPGYHGKEQAPEHLLKEAQKIGFPILLKAANGGGGKGMRAVDLATSFQAALDSAKREARASFGDDTMIIEKLIANPRHVEIQIMADNYGQVFHLHERDCSIQRRHQKIIEEAPAPNLSETMRSQLTHSAIEVAKAIQYQGAGTVEFLVDVAHKKYYFMEMNTRLQVEHPVTEMITGLDLVALQLQVAANQKLDLVQKNIQAQGHAIECRIYAEDPTKDFLPSIGTIQFLEQPQGKNIRIDTGVQLGSQISQYYDPLIAKLITLGKDRNEALYTMQQALDHYAIGGVKTNIPFLKAICTTKDFKAAKFSTNFLDKHTITLEKPNPTEALLMAAACDYLQLIQEIQDPLLQDTLGWQMYVKGNWVWRYNLEDACKIISIQAINKQQCSATLEQKTYILTAKLEENSFIIAINDQTLRGFVQQTQKGFHFYTEKGNIEIKHYTWGSLQSLATQKNQLTAPMPATIVAILKKAGDKVKAGEGLMVLEAMKMEHTIHAPSNGTVKAVFYSVGAQVNEGEELLALEE